MSTDAALAPAPVETTPGTTPKYKSFFAARDALDAALREGEFDDLSGPDIAVLRVLIEHTIFDTRASDYGWVSASAIGVENLMALTRFGRTAVNSALRRLKACGCITVARRPKVTGGSRNAAIRVNGLTDDTPEVWSPKGRETTSPERPRDDLYERPRDDLSSSIDEEPSEERADAGPSGKTGPKAPVETPLERARRRAAEEDQILTRYADQFHGGNRHRAQRHVYNETGGWGNPSDFMRQQLDNEPAMATAR